MKRFTFLASLFSLPLLGQKRKRYGIHADDAVTLPMELIEEQKTPWPIKNYDNPEWYTKGKALNNQCPTCGTMAEAILGNDRHVVFNGDRPGTLLASDMQLHRCLRCNAAFWADSK